MKPQSHISPMKKSLTSVETLKLSINAIPYLRSANCTVLTRRNAIICVAQAVLSLTILLFDRCEEDRLTLPRGKDSPVTGNCRKLVSLKFLV